MKKIVSNVMTKVSKQNISIKDNYKLIRVLQKIYNATIIENDKYEDMSFHLGDRNIKTRLFKVEKSKGLIIFIHGGGWVSGDVDSYTKTCMEIAKKTNRMVLAIDYRLAPEFPYPCGFNDCYEVVRMIMNNLSQTSIKNNEVCIMGDSAGGNLTAAISIKAKKTKEFNIAKQILLYPSLQSDYSNTTRYKSVIEKGKDYLLTQKQLQEYISLYVKDKRNLESIYVNPLKARFLFGQPDTLIITAENDPLRDEGRCYARKLKMYLNYVEYYNLEEAIHGFLTNPLGKKYRGTVYRKINDFLGDDNEIKK